VKHTDAKIRTIVHNLAMKRLLKALKHVNDGCECGVTGHKGVRRVLNGKIHAKNHDRLVVQGKNHTMDLVIKEHLVNNSSTTVERLDKVVKVRMRHV
jgi:hypothetical protein